MPLYPPLNFGYIDENICRSATPNEFNYEFLSTLNLKTVVALTNDSIDANLVYFLESNSIKLIVLTSKLQTVTEEMVTDALKIIIGKSNLPALVICTTGTTLTGVVVGCYRKIQKWSMISIFDEYRRFNGHKLQQEFEQFIQLYDTDLVLQK